MKTIRWLGLGLVCALAGATPGLAQDKPVLVFVVNGASDFWKIAEAGVNRDSPFAGLQAAIMRWVVA